ncbi:lysophospholipase [Actibacterium mucosum KCTC 23349]|uniref:Lysophospholipase n=1 Tax=Actibacterium mucosum KCTC 23349 TaxID=1454373 RepID=A0A037ZG22_9RHOB|nr:DUF1489 domain-containing protein [Actibacterium mucosum]KAJ55098.1 lysophospholipase [Actibacterium mucosum KCTC 23349]
MDKSVNLVKLCVGVDSLDDLIAWRAHRKEVERNYLCRHVTRMWPKREAELLNGGSLYWVFRGVIGARQRILRLDEVIGQDGIRRCGIVMDEEIIRTQPAPRRPFQGWRYLPQADAPADLDQRSDASDLPPELSAALAEIGIR